MNKIYQPVIGLEVHIELATKSKMFCSCLADYFGADPNTHTCPICLGLPGAMPKANQEAIKFTQLLGLALNCQLQLGSKFDRKNYFYPDLPKGYQISQYDQPFCINGYVDRKSDTNTNAQNLKSIRIRIQRAHLEEDTAKLSHAQVNGRRVTLIDFNRSGVPLVEIVSEPDMNFAQEAKVYAQKLQQIVRYLQISDADMEKGSMRIEPNVSLRSRNDKNNTNKYQLPNYKVELKNINSFRFAEKAINYEIERQEALLQSGRTPTQETRGWNEAKNQTVSQRSKEEAHDYRYFPEPDLAPFRFTQNQIKQLADQIPELPNVKEERFKRQYQLSDYDAEILTREKKVADFFEEAFKAAKVEKLSPKQIANIIINQKPDISKVLPATLVKTIVSRAQTSTVSNRKLESIINQVIDQNPKALADYQAGRENALMFLVGQVMRKVGTKLEAIRVKLLLEEKLK